MAHSASITKPSMFVVDFLYIIFLTSAILAQNAYNWTVKGRYDHKHLPQICYSKTESCKYL